MLTSFGFVILISILLDIAGQLNIWRVVTVSGMRAQDLANNLLPGSGYFLAALVVLGGLAFNIGNVAGAGMGLDILFPLDADPTRPVMGACISAALALVIFWVKEAGKAMDWFTKVLGFVMIGLTLYVAIASHPPVGEAVLRTFVPTKINTTAIVTLVGGTVGGYISFAGAHRLLDAGISGQDKLPLVTRSSVNAILLASSMRGLLFLASLGVIVGGGILNPDNPAGSVFQLAAGQTGYYIFGIVLWAASITSVVGSAYTSISFLRSFHPYLNRNYRTLTTVFIVFSALVFALMGKPPVKVLVLAGALNGLILPFALALMLLAVSKQKLLGQYKHPLWMSAMGWLVVAVMSWMGIRTIIGDLGKLWN